MRARAGRPWTCTRGALLPLAPSSGDFALRHHRCWHSQAAEMAIYHLHAAAVVSRKNGQKVIRSAAYRSGQNLYDDRYGELHDFSRKRGVLHEEIFPPSHTPDWMHDREAFWNAVEKAEKRKDSQLAIPYDIALPKELNHN